jgi:hypothetical protein
VAGGPLRSRSFFVEERRAARATHAQEVFMHPIVILFTILCISAPALAQDAHPSPPGELTTYDFEDTLVHGDLPAPNGEVLQARGRGARTSLIRVREHFVHELLKSIEGL